MKTLKYPSTLTNIAITVLFSGMFLFIAGHKINLLSNWLYSSDLFSFDTMLQETLKGNFGLEYTYCNAFGDHAYLSMLLMLPFKLILKGDMVYLLVLVTPILFLAACITLLYYFNKHKVKWYERILLFIPFIFLLDIFKGNIEGAYGFHPDTGTGFLLFIIVLLLDLQNKSSSRPSKLLWPAVLLFLMAKEEMAMLGIFFFGILYLFERKKMQAALLIVSVVVFVIGMYLINVSNTPLNRGNSIIIKDFITAIHEEGLFSVLGCASFNRFWNYIILYCSIFIVSLFFKRVSAIAIALFITGLLKAIFSFLVQDYSFDGWHSFPALAMFMGAIILQFMRAPKNKYANYVSTILLIVLSVISISNFRHDLVYRKSNIACIYYNKDYKKAVKTDLGELKQYIDKGKIISLNHYLAVNFTHGYRYSFYPRGVGMLPEQIATYIIADKTSEKVRHLVQSTTENVSKTGKTGYSKKYENKSFILFKRDEPLDTNKGHCQTFIEKYGDESLGIKLNAEK